MTQLADNFWLWLLTGSAAIVGLAPWLLSIENSYRKEFEYPSVGMRDQLPSLIVTTLFFLAYAWLSRSRTVALTLVPIAVAACSLRGTWRVDRLLLVIPDRLQLLGAVAGLAFISCLLATGEVPRLVFMEAGFGLAMVFLLWSLSAIYLRLRGTVGFGFGDVKLLAWISLFVGKRMPDLILWSIALGLLQLVFSSLQKSLRERRLALPGAQDAFAFGPAIVGATILEVLLFYA